MSNTETHIPAHAPQTAQVTAERVVACNGGGGALGHPKVFLTFHPGATQLSCPYCSQVYVLDQNAASGSGH